MSDDRRPAPALVSEERPRESLAPSRRAIELVAAYGVAQWNVVQVNLMQLGDAHVSEAKARQVAAYGALMSYIAALEQRR